MTTAKARLQCSLPTDEDILNLPLDQRDAHTNKARLKERQLQDDAYCAVRDALGIPYGIENNPLMPPISENPEITLIGGRRGSGKGNTMGFWSSFWRARGYDSLTNMGLLNCYILDDMTDIYALGQLWQNTPVFITEMQTVSSTFEGPSLKTKALMDFYSMIRKLNIPVTMDSSQPHRVYGQIDTELTWYARPENTRYRADQYSRRFPKFCHQRVKYYGPFPIRYPDIGEKLFNDPEHEEMPRSRWSLDRTCGYTAEAIWRASKINFSWDIIEPGALASVDADAMRGKMSNTASLEADDSLTEKRRQVITHIIYMIFSGYLRVGDERWTWKHVYQQMLTFVRDKPLTGEQFEEYDYLTPTWSDLEDAMTYEANINFAGTVYLNLRDLIARYPHFFNQQDGSDEEE